MILKPTIIDSVTVLEKDYDESITVSKDGQLEVNGQTNRLINVMEKGVLIVRGVVGRINCFGGIVVVESDGYCDGIYCGAESRIEIYGRVREVYATQNSRVNVYPTANIVTLCNDSADVDMDKDSYVSYYINIHPNQKDNTHA